MKSLSLNILWGPIFVAILALIPTTQLRSEVNPTWHLIEVIVANTHSNGEDLPTLGLDYEYFPKQFTHHFSLGLSADVEFARGEHEENEYFLGPMFSYYPNHQVKFFYSLGLFWNSEHEDILQRIGASYEYEYQGHYYLIPTVGLDFVEQETHTVVGLGLGHSF